MVIRNAHGTKMIACRDCGKRITNKPKDSCSAFHQNYYKVKRKAYLSGTNARFRERVLVLIGELKCAKCGIADRKVLQINHKNGGGKKDIRSYKNEYAFYRAILDGIRPIGDLELLCANCNIIYEYERGYRIAT